jgi:hypothetical protein
MSSSAGCHSSIAGVSVSQYINKDQGLCDQCGGMSSHAPNAMQIWLHSESERDGDRDAGNAARTCSMRATQCRSGCNASSRALGAGESCG